MNASAKRITAPPADECRSLRAVLSSAPMLPPPAAPEDLLARLEPGEDPFASPDFAAIVSDARARDPNAGWDRFFAAVSHAANTNLPRAAQLLSARPRLAVPAAAGLAALLFWWLAPAGPAPSGAPAWPPVETAQAPALPPVRPEKAVGLIPAEEPPRNAPPTETDLQTETGPLPPEPAVPEAQPQFDAAEPALGQGAQAELAPELEEPDPLIPMEERPVTAEAEIAGAEPEAAAAPVPPARPADLQPSAFTGVWAFTPKACTRAMRRQGYLVADINDHRARAGRTTCTFRRIEGEGPWSITAACSSGRERWKSDIRLTLEGDRLTWESQRGVEVYVRCPRG